MEAKQSTGQVLGGVVVCDGNGKPVTDAAVLGAMRCLLVVECCGRYLQQLDGLGSGDEQEIQKCTNLLALNVIRAVGLDGKALTHDVRVTAQMLGIVMHGVAGGLDAGRMDS